MRLRLETSRGAVADTAPREFGRIDTWVDDPAVSMHGRMTELSIEDVRGQMDVNYWWHSERARQRKGQSKGEGDGPHRFVDAGG